MSPAEEHALRCRRNFLATSASGIGLAALASLLRDDGLLAAPAAATNPLAARAPHFAPKAKACICIYLEVVIPSLRAVVVSGCAPRWLNPVPTLVLSRSGLNPRARKLAWGLGG